MNNLYGRSLDKMQCTLERAYLNKLLFDCGVLESFRDEFMGYIEDGYENFVMYEAFHLISEAVWNNYSEYECVEVLYFSHPDIMEYYRLCRIYGKTNGVKLTDNPYMKNAAAYVHSQLQQKGCYTCSYHLQTKINHEWASGIVFRMWPEFNGQFALLVMMGRIFRFYKTELEKLKAEITVGLSKKQEDTEIMKKGAA